MDFSKMSLTDILEYFESKGIFNVSLASTVNIDVLQGRIENLSDNNQLDQIPFPTDSSFSSSENQWLFYYSHQQLIYDKIGNEYITKEGRFIKRFEKAYKEITTAKLSQTAKALIGDIIQKIASEQIYRVDFVDYIDWKDGEYGKDDSCWWGCYSGSQEIFIDSGGWAIRFYDKNNKGIGRVWCFPFEDSRTFVLFNAYLNFDGGPLDQFARMLANLCGGLKYKRVRLINQEEDNDYPYINDHKGYAVSFTGEFEREYDMDIGERKPKYSCSYCGDGLMEDECYHGNDGIYCENCYNRFYAECGWCNIIYLKDDLTYVESESQCYCEHCLRSYFSTCDNCNESFRERNINYDEESDNNYCNDCYEELLEEREECEKDGEVIQDTVKINTEFKVGDLIIYNPELADDKYGITNKNMICGKIISFQDDPDGGIIIQVLEHRDPDYNNGLTSFPVESKYFIKLPVIDNFPT